MPPAPVSMAMALPAALLAAFVLRISPARISTGEAIEVFRRTNASPSSMPPSRVLMAGNGLSFSVRIESAD
jgi:hypothetical protein